MPRKSDETTKLFAAATKNLEYEYRSCDLSSPMARGAVDSSLSTMMVGMPRFYAGDIGQRMPPSSRRSMPWPSESTSSIVVP
jgi:hypothetical protein